MSEEFSINNSEFINSHLPKDEYIPGSAAPKLPEREQKPEIQKEPEQKTKPAPKPKEKQPSYRFSSALTILGIIAVALCAFFLLSREVSIQQQKNNILELRDNINSLYVERDSLNIKYNSAIDMDNIRDSAIKYGMHAPEEGQLIEID